MNETKKALRFEARRARLKTVLQARADSAKCVQKLFLDNIEQKDNQIIAGYHPLEGEIDVLPIINALPIVEENSRVLRFASWRQGDALTRGEFGIMQPARARVITPDIVLIPLLVFDRRGNRLGQGGGYYDATLANLRENGDILAIGVAHAQQACIFPLPCEAHDQKLDMVITPDGIQRF